MSGSQVGDVPDASDIELLSNDRSSSKGHDGTADSCSAAGSSARCAGAEDCTISFLQKPLGPVVFGALYSAVLNMTAIIGAGILTLPHAMASFQNWGPGIFFLLVSWAATYFSLWQLVEMHEEKTVNEDGQTTVVTYNRYQDLAYRAWGNRGMKLVASMQLVVFVGVTIAYMVTGGLSLLNVYKLLACHYGECEAQRPVLWIFVFSSVQYTLSQRRGFTALFYVSLVAAVMSLSYSGIIFGATIAARGVAPPIPPAPSPPAQAERETLSVWNGFSGLGTIAFAYAGHNVVLDIQSSIPTSARMPSSKLSMLWGIAISYLVVGVCYFAVAIGGYAVFGKDAAANVLGTFAYGTCSQRSLAETEYKGWTVAANIMVAVHLTGTYQIFAMPVYLQLEKVLQERFNFFTRWSNSAVKYRKVSYRIVVRCAYIFFTFIMAILLPDFNNLLGILGGFAFAPTTYFLPCLIWLHIFGPRRWSWMWTVNWGIVVLGSLVMVLSFVGSFATFIIHAFVDRRYRQYWAFDKGCPSTTYVVLRHR